MRDVARIPSIPISFPSSYITDNCTIRQKHGRSKNMEPRRKMPMISTVVLLLYFTTENVLSDLEVIAFTTWRSKMVSVTYILSSLEEISSVRSNRNFIRAFSARWRAEGARHKECNLPCLKEKEYMGRLNHIYILLRRFGVLIAHSSGTGFASSTERHVLRMKKQIDFLYMIIVRHLPIHSKNHKTVM